MLHCKLGRCGGGGRGRRHQRGHQCDTQSPYIIHFRHCFVKIVDPNRICKDLLSGVASNVVSNVVPNVVPLYPMFSQPYNSISFVVAI